jgi:hypothetical protein
MDRGKLPQTPQTASAKRQARLKARRAELGVTQVAVWIPRQRKANFLDAARRMRNEPDLEIGSLRNVRTCVFVSLDPDKPKRKRSEAAAKTAKGLR